MIKNKNRVKVVIRPRPCLAEEVEKPETSQGGRQHGEVGVNPKEGQIRISFKRDPKHANGKSNPGEELWDFKYDHVLEEGCTQQDVYDVCMDDMLKSAMEGYNGTILAYGQTGAGKTHTISGQPNDPKHRGLSSRAITKIFKEIQKREQTSSYVVRVSFLEIYNEQLFDLLDPSGPKGQGKRAKSSDGKTMQIVTDENGASTVAGLTKRLVRNEEEAIACLFEGNTNRIIASHELNHSSTRSHCLLTFYLEGRHSVIDESIGTETERTSLAKLNLVDLAGSERIFKTNSTGMVLQEAKSINKSLSFLEQVVVALAEKAEQNRDHIPYRQSQLTHFLKDSLGGNCKSLLIACIWPTSSHSEQTLATLKFASRMMRIKTSPKRNAKDDAANSAILKEYKKEIHQLRSELALRDQMDVIVNGAELSEIGRTHQPFSVSQLEYIESDIRSFLRSGDLKYVKPQSSRHINTMLNLLREEVLKQKGVVHEMEQRIEREKSRSGSLRMRHESMLGKEHGSNDHINNTSNNHHNNNHDDHSVSPKNREHNINGGDKNGNLIQNNNKNANKSPITFDTREEIQNEGHHENKTHDRSKPDREKLFLVFKTTNKNGKSLFANINQAKSALLETKAKSKDTKTQLNTSKANIDQLIIELKENPGNHELINKLKEEKKKYKMAFEYLKEIKSETAFSSQALKCCRERLADEFEEWAKAQN